MSPTDDQTPAETAQEPQEGVAPAEVVGDGQPGEQAPAEGEGEAQPVGADGQPIPTPDADPEAAEPGPQGAEGSGPGPQGVPGTDADPKPATASTEPFDYETHAPYADNGASPPMPDLSGITEYVITPPIDHSVDAQQAAENGHAGGTGAAGYEVPADQAGRAPDSDESIKAKGKAPTPTT